MDKQVALVTGASSGIGEATALEFAGAGYMVIAVARREARLKKLVEQIELSRGSACYFATDLTSEDNCLQLFEQGQTRFGDIDVLINNAGFGWYGFADEMNWQRARQMIELNIVTITNLTLLFLGEMKKRNRGHIINVSSIAGSLPSQGIAVYSGSKSYVDSFTTSLHRELRDTNVQVSLVKPGAVSTPFFETAAGHGGQRIPAESLAISPAKVAGKILALTKKPRRVVYIPSIMRIVPWIEISFGWLIDRLGPRLLDGGPKGINA